MIVCLGLAPALDVTYGVDRVVAGGIHRPQWTLEQGGGKSVNVARALRLLGVDALAVAPLGGAAGDRVAAELAAEGIPLLRIAAQHPTRVCTSVVDLASGEITEFYPRATDLDAAALADVVAAVERTEASWLVVSGSMPRTAVAPLGLALARATTGGVRIALDVQDEALAHLLPAVRPALVKVNRAEAAAVVGDGESALLAEKLVDAGASAAVVTDGAAGATAVVGGRRWRAAPPERGRFTVGAGDTFFAGLLSVLAGPGAPADDLGAALARGTATAAAGARVPGAGRFDPADIAAIEASVVVETAPLRP